MAKPVHLAEVGSTNDWVRRHRERLSDGQWVVADRQTAGRGRLGRAWEAPPGNFTASCLILPTHKERPWHLLSFVAALALHDCCGGLVDPMRLQLKWPNDLLLSGAKLSGILLETDAAAGAVILGIGVNLVHAPPVAGRTTAALAAAAADVPTPMAFADMLGAALNRRRAQWCTQGFDGIRRDWLERAHPVGSILSVRIDGRQREGRFQGLADDGALEILIDGAGHSVHAGDVFAVGPALQESGNAARD